MERHIAIDRTVAVRSRRGEQILLHTRTRTIWRRRKVCVVCSRAILSFRSNRVVSSAAASEVIYLEVAGSLGEAKVVGEVVHDVVVVEKVRHYSRLLCSWIDGGRERKCEILVCCRCVTNGETGPVVVVGGIVGVCIEVRLDVVAGGDGRRSHPAGRGVDDSVADERNELASAFVWSFSVNRALRFKHVKVVTKQKL